MYNESFEDKQKFFEKIKDPTEFDKFKMILATSACLNEKEIVIPDGDYKTYLANTCYNPYASKFESVMSGRLLNNTDGESYESVRNINFKEKRAKEIAGIMKTHIGEQLCSKCPLSLHCTLETGIREIMISQHGSDELVGTGTYTPVVKGALITNTL